MGRKIHQFCKLTVGCLVIFAFSEPINNLSKPNKNKFHKIIKEILC